MEQESIGLGDTECGDRRVKGLKMSEISMADVEKSLRKEKALRI